MTFPQVVTKLLFFLTTFLALVSLHESSSSSVDDVLFKGSVTCLDCDHLNKLHHYDLSDIKVLVKCNNVKKMVMATTKQDGTFETKLPQEMMNNNNNNKCLTKIVGSKSTLLYTLGKNTAISRVIKVNDEDYYTNENPLNFYKSCPKQENGAEKCALAVEAANFGSSKTVNLPLPREWGLAPSSYYMPFIPIIGIP